MRDERIKNRLNRTDYDTLMSKRINRVLLVCNSYDAFTLEEDGKIETQLRREYAELDLSNPPAFIRVDSAKEALKMLRDPETKHFDLIITMLNVGTIDGFEFARMSKEFYDAPVVLLAHFSRELSLKLDGRDITYIDYIFYWLGNADLILAIVKLFEDKMNAYHDVIENDVQTIILVEDSIRYYSTYLPLLYKLVLQQSHEFTRETLNEEQGYVQRRARPKIMFTTTFDGAVEMYELYKKNTLGVISDISYKDHKGGKMIGDAGIVLCRMVREDDPHMPFLLQSSREDKRIRELFSDVGFIHKYSKTLLADLSDYIVKEFSFGDFIFRDPETGLEIARAKELKDFQDIIKNIDIDILAYHTARNHISKWLMARGLFGLGAEFKDIKNSDFTDLEDMRSLVVSIIRDYRSLLGQGIVAAFDNERYHRYIWFSRIGGGSLGGKARGLAFVNKMLLEKGLFDKYPSVRITIPRTVVLATDIFDDFIRENGLASVINSNLDDDDILQEFVGSRLPEKIMDSLRVFLSYTHNPIAIRSSSKLEDSYFQPFAGIYSTYMIPFNNNVDQMLRQLTKAIKSVYASIYYSASRSYINATSNVLSEEKMAVVLQEVCGTEENNLFFPTMSGVARSVNFYPIGDEKPSEGVATVCLGLGKLVVEGGKALRFSPKHPKKILQLSTPELALRDTQRAFYALDLRPESFRTSTNDAVNIVEVDIQGAASYRNMKYAASTWDAQNERISDSPMADGRKIITFAKLLKYEELPVAEIISELLDIGRQELKTEVEMEFALNMDVKAGKAAEFKFLQIRPIVKESQKESIKWEDEDINDSIIYAESAMGLGRIVGLRDVVYVKGDVFNPAKTEIIAEQLTQLNEAFREKGKNYILIGPGRWGSSDPWLGVPIKWSQISQARVICESGLPNFLVEPSQGTHFFQNMTSFGVGYMTLNPCQGDGIYNSAFLDAREAAFETEYIRHVAFRHPLYVFIDGLHNKGIIRYIVPRREQEKSDNAI